MIDTICHISVKNSVVDKKPYLHVVSFMFKIEEMNKCGYLGKGLSAEVGKWWIRLGWQLDLSIFFPN